MKITKDRQCRASEGTAGTVCSGKPLRQIIQDAVFSALERNNWNKQEAATELGISLKSIYNHIARMDSEIRGE